MRLRKVVAGVAILAAVTAAIGPRLFAQGMGPNGNAGNNPDVAQGPPDGGPGGPGGPGGGGPGGGPDMGPGGPGGGPNGGPDGNGGPDNMGPGGGMGGPPGMRGGGPMGRPSRSVNAMTMYLDLVERYSKLSSDASATSVSAVVSLTEALRPKGPQAIIDELTKLLPEVKDPAVERAIRLQLIDFYRAANQTDKAVEQAEILIKMSGSPATQPTAAQ